MGRAEAAERAAKEAKGVNAEEMVSTAVRVADAEVQREGREEVAEQAEPEVAVAV